MYIAPSRVLVSAEHRSDGLGKLSLVSLVSIASVNPKVSEAIDRCLLCAEPYLLEAGLILALVLAPVLCDTGFGVRVAI